MRDDSNTESKSQSIRATDIGLIVLLVLALTAIVSLRKIKYFKGLLFLIIFLFPFSIANAAEYYVATNGNDASLGTEAQPWQHIAYATCGGSYGCPVSTNNPNKLAAGDTLYIRGGMYSEYMIKFFNYGTLGSPITLQAYTGEKPVIDGGFDIGNGRNPVFDIDNTHYITLDGLTIRRGSVAGIYIAYNSTTSNITIQNSEIKDIRVSDNTGAIYLGTNYSKVIIKNNKLHPETTGRGAGVEIFVGNNDVIIENNEISNTCMGVNYKHSAFNTNPNTPIIRNNLIHDIGGAGLRIGTNNTLIENNIIYNTGLGGCLGSPGEGGIDLYTEDASCDRVGTFNTTIAHNTIVDTKGGVKLNAPSACPDRGARYTTIRDNLFYNSSHSSLGITTIWPFVSSGLHYTASDYNLFYDPDTTSAFYLYNTLYNLNNWKTATNLDTNSIWMSPLFQDYTNRNFTLLPNSPGYKAASDGYDMGADTSLLPTPTPDGGGGNTTPPPSSGSGGDTSASGGGGCGFVKDDSNRVSKSQSGKVTDIGMIVLLVFAMTAIFSLRKIKYFKGFLFLIIFLFPFSIANAATYYVDQNNAAASDSNTGTETLPWKTLKKATNTVQAGDTVIVKTGVYIDSNAADNYSAFNPANLGTAGNPITFRSEPRYAAIVRAKDLPASRDYYAWGINSQNYIIIDGFKFEGGAILMHSSYSTIQYCDVSIGRVPTTDPSLNWGIAIHSSSYSTVRNNYVHNMLSSGNTAHNTAGIMVYGPNSSVFSSYNIIENNLVDAGGGTVYSAYGQKGGNITHNIWRNNIARNATTGFLGMGSTDDTQYSDYNEYYNNIIYNTTYAFELDHNSRWFKIYNNTAYNITNDFLHGSYNNSANELMNNIAVSVPKIIWTSQVLPTTLLSYSDYNNFYGYSSMFANYKYSLYAANLSEWKTKTGFDSHSTELDPLFVDPNNNDFHLQANSPAKGKGSGGVDMGAYATGNEVIGPTDGGTGGGGNSPPPPSSGGSGGDASASGGSGCGFIKNDDGKGQGAKGEGIAMMILLVLALSAIALFRKVKYFKGLLFLIIFLFPFSIANAATYYVDQNNAAASDSNTGTEVLPWKTIQKASDTMVAGDTVLIKEGVYFKDGTGSSIGGQDTGGIQPKNSGSSGSPITFKAYPGHKVIIDQNFESIGFFIYQKDYITIDGLEIRNCWWAGIRTASDTSNLQGLVIQNNKIHDIRGPSGGNIGAIRPDNAVGAVIRNNQLYNISIEGSNQGNASGIHCYNLRDSTVESNEIWNAGNGIFYKRQYVTGNITRYNYIHDINKGLHFNSVAGYDSCSNHTVHNNIIYRANVAVSMWECDDGVSQNNKFYNNTIVDSPTGFYMVAGGTTNIETTQIWNNIIYNTVDGGSQWATVIMMVDTPSFISLSDYNDFYETTQWLPISWNKSNYTFTEYQSASGFDANSISADPLFVDKANQDFHLQSSSPAKGKGLGGVDMGAYATGNEVIGPTDGGTGGGGGNTPPSSSNSGGDTGGGSGGGGGCGFVKDSNSNSGSKSQGVKLADIGLMIMLIITLCLLPIAKRLYKVFNRPML